MNLRQRRSEYVVKVALGLYGPYIYSVVKSYPVVKYLCVRKYGRGDKPWGLDHRLARVPLQTSGGFSTREEALEFARAFDDKAGNLLRLKSRTSKKVPALRTVWEKLIDDLVKAGSVAAES